MHKYLMLSALLSLALIAVVPANAMMPVASGDLLMRDQLVVNGSQGLIMNAKVVEGSKSASVRKAERACAHYRNRSQRRRCMHEHGM